MWTQSDHLLNIVPEAPRVPLGIPETWGAKHKQVFLCPSPHSWTLHSFLDLFGYFICTSIVSTDPRSLGIPEFIKEKQWQHVTRPAFLRWQVIGDAPECFHGKILITIRTAARDTKQGLNKELTGAQTGWIIGGRGGCLSNSSVYAHIWQQPAEFLLVDPH